MTSSMFSLHIEVDGHTIPEFGHDGRTYSEGKKGKPFILKFKNNSPSKVFIVPSIDGLSTFDGQVATINSGGYVVHPYSSAAIRGWRTSLEEVADFVFDDKACSYSSASEKGDQNCGVIACRVFSEKVAHLNVIDLCKLLPDKPAKQQEHHHHHYHGWPYTSWPGTINPIPSYPHITCCADSLSAGAHSAPNENASYSACVNNVQSKSISDVPDFNLGTAWGSPSKDAVKLVEFEIDKMLCQMEIFYSDRAGLEAAGITLEKKVQAARPFPMAYDGFCKPPVQKCNTKS